MAKKASKGRAVNEHGCFGSWRGVLLLSTRVFPRLAIASFVFVAGCVHTVTDEAPAYRPTGQPGLFHPILPRTIKEPELEGFGHRGFFLVRAADSRRAAELARRIFGYGWVRDDSFNESVPAWAVYYFDTGDSAMYEEIAIEKNLKEKRIRLSYTTPDPKGALMNCDIVPNGGLIELGSLPDGDYTLELFNRRTRRVTLMHRWALGEVGAGEAE